VVRWPLQVITGIQPYWDTENGVETAKVTSKQRGRALQGGVEGKGGVEKPYDLTAQERDEEEGERGTKTNQDRCQGEATRLIRCSLSRTLEQNHRRSGRTPEVNL